MYRSPTIRSPSQHAFEFQGHSINMLEVKSNCAVVFPIPCDSLLVFNSNIWPNLPPLRGTSDF